MRIILFFAVFALATQVHTSQVTEFYRTFINNIPMEAEAKNYFMNEGLACINWATNLIASSLQNIKYDIHNEDIVSTLRHAIGSLQVLEKEVIPQCTYTYGMLMTYLEKTGMNPALRLESQIQAEIFHYRLLQLTGKTVVDVLNQQPNAAAKDLATLVGTVYGLIDAELPHIKTLDWNKQFSGPKNLNEAVSQLLRGFFTAIGINDLAKINATSQCAIDILESIKTIAMNPAVQRGDFYTRANAFLDSTMVLTDSLERCKKLNMVEPVFLKRMAEMFRQYPALSLSRVFSNTILDLPNIGASEINFGVHVMEGEYELAGRLLGMNIQTIFNGVMF